MPAAADRALRRFERDAILACLAMSAVALIVAILVDGADLAARAALGVLGGGLLMALSYRAIKGAVDVLVEVAVGQTGAEAPFQTESPGGSSSDPDSAAEDWRSEQDFSPAHPPALSSGRRAVLAVKFFTRYALLAVAAYVMLTCFRLHPVGILAGATSPFLAALMQLARLARARRQHP